MNMNADLNKNCFKWIKNKAKVSKREQTTLKDVDERLGTRNLDFCAF